MAAHEFHHNVGSVGFRLFAHIEDGYNPRMRQAPRRFGLPKESFAILPLFFRWLAGQGKSLYRNDPVYFRIARFVDHAHGSASQFSEDLVSPKTFGLMVIPS